MSKRALSGKAKDKGPARDGPEGRPPNRPSYQPSGRPTSHLVARLTGASLGRGGRGGSSSTLGNGDQFADDRGNIWEYFDEGIRPSRRPSGRCDSSSASRDGDHCADNHKEYLEESMLGMESWQYRRGSHMSDTPHTQSSLKSWSDMIDRVWQRKLIAGRENRHTFVDGRVSKHTASSIWIDLHHLRKVKERDVPVSSIEVYQRCHMKRGLVSEYITTREKNVAEKCSYLMEEKYGANRACHPCVGDREIWERACGGPSKKRRFFGFGSPMDIDLALTATSSTPTTCSSSTRYSGVASSEEVEKVAQERERVAKELQVAGEERKRVVEQRLKELKEQVKDIANMLKTLIPPRSSPPS